MSNQGSPENRRHFTRIPMDSEVNLSCGDQHYKGQLLDISLKGALMETPEAPDSTPSGNCQLSLTLNGTDITISMEGEIVHHQGAQLGMRCDSIDLESITHLKRIVELNLGDESLLERELAELLEVSQ